MREALQILVADDHGIVRMGLIQIIKELLPYAELHEVEDYDSLYDLVARQKFDLAILDVKMPNGSFQEAIDYINIKQPDLKTLVFSSQDELLYAARYIKMGANGFLHKLSSKEEINRALNTMIRRGNYLSDEVKDAMIFDTPGNQKTFTPAEVLSNRELEVAYKLCEGSLIKDISDQLNLHTSTVSTYKNRIFEKLKIQSVPELIEVLRMYES